MSMDGRIIIIDDTPAIHEDIRSVLLADNPGRKSDSLAADLFGRPESIAQQTYEVDSAYQGDEALAMVGKAVKEGNPYALAFVDVRMPPGMDGIETIQRLWEMDPDIQVAVITAYADYDFNQMSEALKFSDQYFILKKPFEAIEVRQAASALVKKWKMAIEMRQHNAQLEKIAAKYRDLYDNAPDMFVSVDADTAKIKDCNNTLLTTLGYSREEVLGHPIFEMYHPDCMAEVEEVYRLFVDTGEVGNRELQLKRRDGSKIDVMIKVSAVRDAQGKILYSRSAWRDITERKKAEALERENVQLLELDKLKSMFIASMSHELRTPLNSIIGFTSITLEGINGELNDTQRDQLQRVYKAGKHLLSLISDVIDISKVEAGRIELFPVEFSLQDVVDEAMGDIQAQAEKKKLSFDVAMPTGEILLYTDRQRLLQCLLNLMSNAVKFTELGGITVSIQENGDDVDIAVSDTGIGIAQADMPRLFEAFERLDSPLRIKAGGTGLGLYLTHKICTATLQGRISVDSTPGKGSTFTLRIPRRLEKNSAPA